MARQVLGLPKNIKPEAIDAGVYLSEYLLAFALAKQSVLNKKVFSSQDCPQDNQFNPLLEGKIKGVFEKLKTTKNPKMDIVFALMTMNGMYIGDYLPPRHTIEEKFGLEFMPPSRLFRTVENLNFDLLLKGATLPVWEKKIQVFYPEWKKHATQAPTDQSHIIKNQALQLESVKRENETLRREIEILRREGRLKDKLISAYEEIKENKK